MLLIIKYARRRPIFSEVRAILRIEIQKKQIDLVQCMSQLYFVLIFVPNIQRLQQEQNIVISADHSFSLELIGDGDLMIEDMLIYSDKLQQPNTIELVISKDL